MRVWQTISVPSLERHSHHTAYATLVITGAYEEAGDQGRFKVEPADVIIHSGFEAHLNRFARSGTHLLNLPLPSGRRFSPGSARIADPDLILRAAERSSAHAVELLLLAVQQQQTNSYDWPDELAAALREDPSVLLGHWADEHGLAPWRLSRGFQQVYGISPESFRSRMRARLACKMIQTTTVPLIDIAYATGFADQAHMNRTVKRLTGRGPRALRLQMDSRRGMPIPL